ncbi:MAG: FkbM family methyltransferase [Candidatus Limnocylindria bacterium]
MRASEEKILRFAATVLGALPDGLGQFRAAHRWAVTRRPAGPTVRVQRMADGTRMSLDLADRTQAIAYLVRRHEAEVSQHVVRRLPRGGVFFDVGANVGLITFAVARKRPDATIIAFEPNSVNVERWECNRGLNAASAQLVAEAVTDTPGTALLTLDLAADTGSGRLADHGIEVRALTLDDYCGQAGIGRIDIMKMDIQGHEATALRGARRLLGEGRIGALLLEEVEVDPGLHAELTGFGFVREPVRSVGLRRFRSHPPMGDAAYVRVP